MKKYIRNGLLTLWVAGALYTLAPKWEGVVHKVKTHLVDALGDVDILADKETNDIIGLISGTITKDDYSGLMKKHTQIDGMSGTGEGMDFTEFRDSTLCKAILHMQTKYGNPKISFSGDFWDGESQKRQWGRPEFSHNDNTMHLWQLDSMALNIFAFSGSTEADIFFWTRHKGWQSILLNGRIWELVHARQLKEWWLSKYTSRMVEEQRMYGSHKAEYNAPWTLEYEGHKQYEPQMAQELIETYKQYMPQTPESYYKLAKLYGWMLYAYKDAPLFFSYLSRASEWGCGRATYFLGKYCTETYKDYIDHQKHSSYRHKYVPLWSTLCKPEDLLRKAEEYYIKAYHQWSVWAAQDLIELYNHDVSEEHDDRIIEMGEDILTNHHAALQKLPLHLLYFNVGRIYEKRWQKIKPLRDYMNAKK